MLHHLKTELPDRDDVDSILLEALNKRRDIYVCIKGEFIPLSEEAIEALLSNRLQYLIDNKLERRHLYYAKDPNLYRNK